jgi:hypothetical protein
MPERAFTFSPPLIDLLLCMEVAFLEGSSNAYRRARPCRSAMTCLGLGIQDGYDELERERERNEYEPHGGMLSGRYPAKLDLPM